VYARACACVCVCVCTQNNSVGIQIPKNWNFSVRNMTAPLPMLSPSSTLPSLSFNFPFISAIKSSARAGKGDCVSFYLFKYCVF
jgi:hypothetical protein